MMTAVFISFSITAETASAQLSRYGAAVVSLVLAVVTLQVKYRVG